MMKKISSKEDYISELQAGAALPEGFSTGCVNLEFSPAELDSPRKMKMNLSLIMMNRPTKSFAGVFTRNLFPGAPVLLCRKRLDNPLISGILINNKVANVCTAAGVEDSEQVLDALAEAAGCRRDELMAASTGVIGWSLPVGDMRNAVPALVGRVKSAGADAVELAEGIMTTDSFPKIRSRQLCGGRITAVAKGAGMIEPNMATMLCFIMTDIDVDRAELRRMLPAAVEKSFNRISVDGDQSTSDMVIALSSGRKPCNDLRDFEQALTEICSELAADIVRNGEGTGHVIRVNVSEAADEQQAAGIAKALVNSPLVKTAIAGNDPNVGRFASSIGDFCGNSGISLPVEKMRIVLGGELIFSEGLLRLDPEKEKRLSAYLKDCGMDPEIKGFPQHEKSVEIDIIIGTGTDRATIYGSDLTHEYVRENADYRT